MTKDEYFKNAREGRITKFSKYVWMPRMMHNCGYLNNPNLMRAYLSTTISATYITKKKYVYDMAQFIVGVNDCDDGFLSMATRDMDLAIEMYNKIVDGITIEDLEKLGFRW